MTTQTTQHIVKETTKPNLSMPCYAVLDAEGRQIALFETESDAYAYRQWIDSTSDDRLDAALNTVRSDYYADVRDIAESITQELEGRLAEQECGESLREWLIEHIDETIDGCGRVIYTQQAMLGLYASDNDGAYIDEFGSDGIAENGAINWSLLMYSALRMDVCEQLEADGLDLNKPVPECASEYSGAVWCDEDGDNERYKVGDTWVCEGCHDVMEAITAIPSLSRETITKLLTGVSIECSDDEELDTLAEALRVNVSDGTIDASDVLCEVPKTK